MNVMVFAPHPDDDVLGSGGSIIKLRQANNPVTIVYVTSGEAADENISKTEMAKNREAEAKKGAEIMGVNDIIFLHFHDGTVESSPENTVKIRQLLWNHKPDIIYIPHKDDEHRDHKATHALVMEAVRQIGKSAFQNNSNTSWNINTIFEYEVWKKIINYQNIEDISDVMETKIRAIKAHTSQLRIFHYIDYITELNKVRGTFIGTGKYAECFGVVKINSIG